MFILNRYVKFLSGITADTLINLKEDGINLFSLIFGNTVGLINTRKGYMHDQPKIESYLHRQLQPGDILLEKTPFRLTDKLIPGYWGHAAVWVGNENELRALEIWSHPVVIPFQEKIRNGKLVAEALRPGVKLNSLSHFLNIDDLAVIHPKSLTKKQRSDIVLRTLRQIGKPFDFNFDIESDDRIICSELVYIAYADIDWPTKNTLGRYTVSPSHIAEKVGDEGPFEIASLFIKGQMITTKMQNKFKALK